MKKELRKTEMGYCGSLLWNFEKNIYNLAAFISFISQPIMAVLRSAPQ